MPGVVAVRHTQRLTWALALVLAVLLWPSWGFAGVMVALVFGRLMALDLTTYTLPNVYTVPLMMVGLLVAVDSHLMGTLVVWLALLLVAGVARRWSRQGLLLGEGDLKLLAAMVGCLGPISALAALAAGCLLWLPGAWVAPKQPLPLGVPLLLGWAVVLAYPALPSVLFSPITL